MPNKKAPKKTDAKKKVVQLRAETDLVKEINKLTKQVERFQDLEVMYVYKKPFKFLGFALLKGLMIGFGSVLGASFLVGLFIYLVAQIQLVPFVGDFVNGVLQELDTNNIVTEKVTEDQ